MTIDTTAARLPVLNWTRPYRRIKEAASLAEAIKTLRGDDPRPLLIQWEGEGELKDAPARQKTARATFSGHDTFLLAPFFQCYQIEIVLSETLALRRHMTLTVRVFDDGLGFRFTWAEQGVAVPRPSKPHPGWAPRRRSPRRGARSCHRLCG